MILNKNYFALSGMALLAMAFVACNDDDPTEVYVGNMSKYQKAYITTGVSQPNGAVFKGSYSGKLQLSDEGKLVFVQGTAMIPSGGSFDTDIYFRTTYAVKKSISGTVDVVPDAEDFVARYNAEHQTQFKLLPEAYYTLENTRATIAAGSKSTSIHISVHTDLDWEFGEFLLPLGVTLDKDAGIALSEDNSTVCLQYSIVSPGYLLSSDDYEIALASGSADSHPENAFDGDRNTSWSAGNASSDVVVTFKEPHRISRVCVLDCGYVYYTWMSYEETPDTFFGGSYTWGENPGLSELNVTNLGYNASRKVKRVKIRNYYTDIADIYFLVKD